ncbi:hypothetical protein ABCR94_17025 [Streptomyces sp. 21So2-11]|uniref:hypothetical protein n=1 Tax=Streptomyces sp. 21So2-11 TaxID=3144408 RepID=UPI00321AA508
MTGSIAYLSDDFTGPTSWLLPPIIVLFHLVIGLLYGHRKMPLTLVAVVLPPAIIVMTVLCAVSFSDMHGARLNPFVLGAAWASIFSAGLLSLTYAERGRTLDRHTVPYGTVLRWRVKATGSTLRSRC